MASSTWTKTNIYFGSDCNFNKTTLTLILPAKKKSDNEVGGRCRDPHCTFECSDSGDSSMCSSSELSISSSIPVIFPARFGWRA